MGSSREMRRMAFQVLFQLDARGDLSAEEAAALDEAGELSESQRSKAVALARSAYMDRPASDQATQALAPGWPAHRQPSVDRAILRLAHYELTHGGKPSVVINEAVELAKSYGTEKSPGFVNALLDKIAKALPKTADSGLGEDDESDRASEGSRGGGGGGGMG